MPLVFATGAGAVSRQSLGTAVVGGMLTSTILAIFFVPVFYVAIQSLIELRNGPPKRPAEGDIPVAGHGLHNGNGQAGVNGEAMEETKVHEHGVNGDGKPREPEPAPSKPAPPG
jgi:HAE1 family hydrophobic/amphiphilic exporter-1